MIPPSGPQLITCPVSMARHLNQVPAREQEHIQAIATVTACGLPRQMWELLWYVYSSTATEIKVTTLV